MIQYGIIKESSLVFDEALEKVYKLLQEEGFGVLTRINLHDKLKEKLNVDYHKYVILGACNPPFAYQALQAEPEIGLLLPCNVIVYERDGKTIIGAIRPTEAMKVTGNTKLTEIAEIVEEKLTRLIESF